MNASQGSLVVNAQLLFERLTDLSLQLFAMRCTVFALDFAPSVPAPSSEEATEQTDILVFGKAGGEWCAFEASLPVNLDDIQNVDLFA